jgi:hypothetical protein
MTVHRSNAQHMLQETSTNITIIIFFMFHSGCCMKHDDNIVVEVFILESDVRIIYIHIFFDVASISF